MYKRKITDEVKIGNLKIGHKNPILIQSMTTTRPSEIEKTLEQCHRLVKAGCQLVRITVPSKSDALTLPLLKKELKEAGINIPLVADIHFNPQIANIAAQYVEKVRINPGNFADKKNISFKEGLKKIENKLIPFLAICKKNNTAIRIGTNHGSLSERIMNKYGNTSEGMVESAMEFLRICKINNFKNIVLSMKASNPVIMIEAYRKLVLAMDKEDMKYPLHLGVTEAGNQSDGRIKSAVGIGTLLEEGIGDTIRISLTESPEKEIKAAQKLLKKYNKKQITFFDKYKLEDLKLEVDCSFNFKYPVICKKNTLKQQKPDIIFDLGEKEGLIDFDTKKLLILPYEQLNSEAIIQQIFDLHKDVIVLIKMESEHPYLKLKHVLRKYKFKNPIFVKIKYNFTDKETLLLNASADFGSMLIDNLIEGIWIDNDTINDYDFLTRTSFNILQATGKRITKTEFISCPTCGRTMYNVEKTLSEAKQKLSKLKGLKIAIMGCVVNGPGELADADYGYIGMGKGKVAIYKGKKPVKKGVDSSKAIQIMLEMIENDRKK